MENGKHQEMMMKILFYISNTFVLTVVVGMLVNGFARHGSEVLQGNVLAIFDLASGG